MQIKNNHSLQPRNDKIVSILVMDANPHYTEYIHNLILQLGDYRVEIVDHPGKAYDALRTLETDILLIDINFYLFKDMQETIDEYLNRRPRHCILLIDNDDANRHEELLCKKFMCVHKTRLAQSLHHFLREFNNE